MTFTGHDDQSEEDTMTDESLIQRAIIAELDTGALDALREVQVAFERAAQYAHDSDDSRYNEAATLDLIAAGIDSVWREACRGLIAGRPR